ncbi:hypothetical protein [Vibrio europaeus]|uniref:hypothetical protein n=1 Tax=Vibrio europaeus TaxID=300876 RepID=UPI00233EEFF5|nr:hypothetical protein [Vibrio europaeus]MDC5753539.1 hypothetical protein [Vibrio europaeus]MDC5816548.1 hypothetical protein [Vibrio europaeus]
MTETIQLTETAKQVQASIRPALSQLELAQGNVQGIAKTSVDTAYMLVKQVEQMVIELTNKDYDDYNALVDQAEALQDTLITTQKSLTEAEEKLESAELEREEAKGESAMAATELKALRDQLRVVNDDMNAIKALNPEKLKSKNASLKESLAEKSEIINQQLIKIRTLRTDLAKTKQDYALATDNNLLLKQTCEEQYQKLCEKDGLMLREPYESKGDSSLKFYMHFMGYNLEVGAADVDEDAVRLIGDLGFHLVLRTTYCIDAVVNFTTWLSPVLPSTQHAPFITEVPDQLIADLHEEIYERVQESHPDLVKRVDWAKGVSLAELDIKDKYLEPLRKGGFSSIYDVCESRGGRVAERCAGIGEAAEKEIRKACDSLVHKWRVENKFKETAIKKAA